MQKTNNKLTLKLLEFTSIVILLILIYTIFYSYLYSFIIVFFAYETSASTSQKILYKD